MRIIQIGVFVSEIKILINDFRQYLAKQDLSQNTIRNYIADIENFVSWHDQHYGEEVEVKKLHHIT